MRFLADESCDFRVVAALREAGHEVAAVAEVARGAPDTKVLSLARIGHHILITEDRDFGQLIFADTATTATGVLYLRCPESSRRALPARIVSLVAGLGSQLERSFTVWAPKRVRIRSLKGR